MVVVHLFDVKQFQGEGAAVVTAVEQLTSNFLAFVLVLLLLAVAELPKEVMVPSYQDWQPKIDLKFLFGQVLSLYSNTPCPQLKNGRYLYLKIGLLWQGFYAKR